MMSWTGLHKFADIVFEITQQLLYITSSNFVRQCNNSERNSSELVS